MTDDASVARGTPRPGDGPARPDDADDTLREQVDDTLREPPTAAAAGPGEQTAGEGWSGAAPGAGEPGGGPGRMPPPGRSGPEPGFAYRYGLVRPREGRYLAGVCAAIGRATNSDPILWRVLLAVLGFFGGIGILVYLAAWLIIPAEGDTASPIESMLGRGRSSMSPVTVLVLSILVVVLFSFIVTDTYRAVLLGVAVLIGGALLLNRPSDRVAGQHPPDAGHHPVPPGGHPSPAHPPATAGPVPFASPGQPGQPAPPGWPNPPSGGGWPPSAPPTPVGPAGYRAAPTAPPGPIPAAGYQGPAAGWAGAPGSTPGLGTPPTAAAPPPGYRPPSPGHPVPPTGYRPPFAPHGPYAGNRPGPEPTPSPARPPAPPREPRERSRLGAATFSLIFVAIGVVALLDLAGAIDVGPSAYFAAALVTIALGLLVGAWIGRARWLIALGLVASCALGISTAAESYRTVRSEKSVVWAPTSHDALADRYQVRFGSSTLDLTQLDFGGRETRILVEVSLGEVKVLLPPEVDVTVVPQVSVGEALVLGDRLNDAGGPVREIRDTGTDGPGGGSLLITLRVNAAYAEVTR